MLLDNATMAIPAAMYGLIAYITAAAFVYWLKRSHSAAAGRPIGNAPVERTDDASHGRSGNPQAFPDPERGVPESGRRLRITCACWRSVLTKPPRLGGARPGWQPARRCASIRFCGALHRWRCPAPMPLSLAPIRRIMNEADLAGITADAITRNDMPRPQWTAPQTNEIARSAMLLPGFRRSRAKLDCRSTSGRSVPVPG